MMKKIFFILLSGLLINQANGAILEKNKGKDVTYAFFHNVEVLNRCISQRLHEKFERITLTKYQPNLHYVYEIQGRGKNRHRIVLTNSEKRIVVRLTSPNSDIEYEYIDKQVISYCKNQRGKVNSKSFEL